MSQRIKTILFALTLTTVVMCCTVAACPALAADDQYKSDAKSGEVSDWATLFGWLSDINGHLGLIYAEMSSLSATVDFTGYFDYPLYNNIPMKTYLYQDFTNVSNIASRLSTSNTYLNALTKTTATSGKLGLFNVINAIDSVNTSIGATNTTLGELMSSSTQSGQIRLRNLANLLNSIYGDTSSINNYVQSIDDYTSNLYNMLGYWENYLSDIDTTTDKIRSKTTENNVVLGDIFTEQKGTKTILSNLETPINKIRDYTLDIEYITQDIRDRLDSHFDDLLLALENLNIDVGDIEVTVDTSSLERLVSATNDELSIISGQLDRILLYLIITDVQEDLIGDFDWIDFRSKINALTDDASDKLPFSAFALFTSISSMAIFNSAPSTLPELTIPFNFAGGSANTLTISNAMLNQAQPYIHFAVMLLFIYSLAVVTMRFVYRD